MMIYKEWSPLIDCTCAGNILWMPPANERWRYISTSSLIGWAHTQMISAYVKSPLTGWDISETKL